MSDLTTAKKRRSPINATKILNELRVEKGLPKVSKKAKAVLGKKKITKDEKLKLAQQVWKDLYPEWNKKDFIIPEDAEKKVVAEYSKRLTALEK
jgi:hypothetical protein